MFRLTIAQVNPTIGALTENIDLMLKAALCAQSQGAHLVVFPELSLLGYYPGDLLEDGDFQRRMALAQAQLLEASTKAPEVHWVVGLPLQNRGPGKPLHNGLLVLKNGLVVMEYAKQLLPTYNVFDERRHFEPGPDVARILNIDGTRVGFLICEDAWNDEGRDYPVNPFERLRDAAPDLVVSLNASPSNRGKREQRFSVIGRACARNQLPLVYVNQVGGHDQLVYDGGSFAMDSRGAVVFEAKRFEEEVVTLGFMTTTKSFYLPASPQALPAVASADLPVAELYRRQIRLGIRDYARRCGFQRALVGCSGGIDSALTLALAVEALGAQNVLAVTMPSEYSSEGSVSDSVDLCQNLGVKLLTHPIKGIVNRHRADFRLATGEDLQGLALENLQARIRGTILMAYSNSGGHLLLTTGNKSEISVGYSTLYGDSNGGLGPIGDLYKTEVYELARHLNAVSGEELIPAAILDKEPSAELAPGQRDADSLPPYEQLDAALKFIIEGTLLSAEEMQQALQTIIGAADAPALLSRIRSLVARSEYKRRQAAPILRLRPRAFGSGRQLPIAARHN